MTEYLFETKDFGLSAEGIHFLRSRFNYKTIAYNEVRQISIEKGKEINNWLVVLIIGIGLIVFSVFYSVNLYFNFIDPNVHVIYIEQIVTPVLPIILGFYCIFSSLKQGIILIISISENKKVRFPLKDIIKGNRKAELIKFLAERLNIKFKNNI